MPVNPPNEDLFKETTMTFGEHLDELRTRLIRGVLGLTVGVLIGLFFGTNVVDFIQKPFLNSLETYYKNQALVKYEQFLAEKRAQGLNLPDDRLEVKHMVMDLNLLWRELQVQPWQLQQALGRQYGGRTGEISFLGPGEFEANDFLKPEAFCAALRTAGEAAEDAADPVLRRIWKSLSAEARAALTATADAEATDDAEAAARQALLGLNELLSQRLRDDAGWLETPLFGEAAALVEQESGGPLSGAAQARLNRLLIENALRESKFLRLTQPQLITFLTWHPVNADERIKLRTLNAQEAFMIYIKASLVLGAILGGPILIYQMWLFVAAGLYPHEKHYVHVFLPFSVALFLAGAAFCYFLVIGLVLDFLLEVNTWMGLDPEPRISEWLGFVIMLPLGFGVSFQLPLVMLFLQRIGIFDVRMYIEKWRIAFLAIAVIAMILTPADPASMLLMAVPLWVLYFGGIGLCRWMPATRNPYRNATAAEN